MVSNLPFGSGADRHRVLTGPPDPRQHPFGSGQRPYPAGYAGRPAEALTICPGFPLPFGDRRWLLGSSCARWGVGPSLRSAYRRPSKPDPNGVSTFHTSEIRPGWVPPKLRDGDALPADVGCSAGACRFSTASPAPRWINPSAGLTITKHRQGFTRVHPSGLPLACGPRMEQGLLGFSFELHTPPLPATHVEVGTGLEHWPGTTLSTSSRSSCQVIHSISCDFVSHPSAHGRGVPVRRPGRCGGRSAWWPAGTGRRYAARPGWSR
jgi:hypothetical protein